MSRGGRAQRNHPPLFGVHLNELPLSDGGIPLVLEVMCKHLLSNDAVQRAGLFSTEPSAEELDAVKKHLEESRGSNVNLAQFPATVTAALMGEFFSLLPVPVCTHLSGAFLKALVHQKPALQIAELKALLRQLPDVHRGVLLFVLRFMLDVSAHEHSNGASRQTLAEALATTIFREFQREDEDEEDDDWDADQGSPQDKQKLVLLMLSYQTELEGNLRSRATRAGVIPEGTLTVGSSPASALSSVQNISSSTAAGASGNTLSASAGDSPGKTGKSPQSSGTVVGTSQGTSHAVGEVVEQLPFLLDEGHAAVRQLTDSNQALVTLLKHFQSQIADRESPESAGGFASTERESGALRDVRQRLDKCEEAQANAQDVLESVERRLAPLPSEVEFKAIKAKLDGTDKDSWNKAVQGRLEEIEERLDRLAEDEEEGEGRKGVGMSSDEVARMVKTAVDDALLRADRARNEEHSSWRLQVEKDMEAWKKKIERETKSEAAVAAAAAIKGALEESKAATKEVREALASLGPKDAGESPGQSPAGGGGLNVALEEMEQFRQELKGVNDRLGNHEDRLDDILKTHDENDEKMCRLSGDAEAVLERVNTQDKMLAKLQKWQDDFVQEPLDLRDVRSKLDSLSKAVSDVKNSSEASAVATGPAEGADSPLLERVGRVEAQVQEVEDMVKEAVTHVEALRDVSTQAVTSMHELKMQNLARGDGGSGTSNEATLAVILEHLNPEISSMREAVHSLQAKLGERDPGEDGAEEDEGNADSGEQKGPVLVQLAKLWAAVEDGPSAQRFDALAAQADSTQEQVAEMNQHLDRQLAALKKSDSASPSATSADTPSNVSELLDRLEKVEDDVSTLIGARDASKNALGDAEKRMQAEVKHVDVRLGELFDKVEALVAGVTDSVAARETLEALQMEQETLKRNAQQFKTRNDEVKQRADDAHDKVRALEQKFIKEMEDKDDELEALTKVVQQATAAGAMSAAAMPSAPAVAAAEPPVNVFATTLVSKLTDQVKRLEGLADASATEQEALSERTRDNAGAIRKLQNAVEQLDVHRGAVYVSDVALQKLEEEVRRLGLLQETLREGVPPSSSDGSVRTSVTGLVAGSDGETSMRLREQLNFLRAEMDAGFIKQNNTLDAAVRGSARAEALGKSLEALVKQTREELTSEVELERERVSDAEVKVRKVGERIKKQLDEALEEMRASLESLEEQRRADSGSKGLRKSDAAWQQLLDRTDVLEEEVQRLGELTLESTRGTTPRNQMDAETTVTIVALRELEGKVARVEHVQLSDGKRLSSCEQDVAAAKAELRRCVDTVVNLGSGRVGAGVGSAISTPVRPSSRAHSGQDAQPDSVREGVDVVGERQKWATARVSSSDESADEEAHSLSREGRFRSRGGKALSQQGSVRSKQGGHRRRSASPSMRMPAASDSVESDDLEAPAPIRRPASAMRERPRPASAQRQPFRATYDTRGSGVGANSHKGGAARGLDRAVERELTQLKRMFGL